MEKNVAVKTGLCVLPLAFDCKVDCRIKFLDCFLHLSVPPVISKCKSDTFNLVFFDRVCRKKPGLCEHRRIQGGEVYSRRKFCARKSTDRVLVDLQRSEERRVGKERKNR